MKRFWPISKTLAVAILLHILVILRIVFPGVGQIVSHRGANAKDIHLTNLISRLDNKLPHVEFQAKADSIEREFQSRQLFSETYLGISAFGISKPKELSTSDNYFLSFADYEITDKSFPNFYRENGKNYVESERGSREISVAYQDESDGGSMFVPVSKTFAKTAEVLMWTVGLTLVALLLVFCISRPLRLFNNIGNGEIFTIENISILTTMSWVLIFVGLFNPVVKIILHFSFQRLIPSELSFSYAAALMDGIGFVIAGLVVWLLADAFKRGSHLKQEQDLVV